jgi:hypothetical protein
MQSHQHSQSSTCALSRQCLEVHVVKRGEQAAIRSSSPADFFTLRSLLEQSLLPQARHNRVPTEAKNYLLHFAVKQ